MGLLKQRQKMLIPNLLDSHTMLVTEPGSGISADDKPVLPRKCRLTFTNATLSVTAALDYGSLKIVDLQDRNLLLLGVEADLTLTKQNNTNGILDATDLDVGMGTVAASNVTLATTMIDILEKMDVDADTNVVAVQRHTNDQATAVFPKKLPDAAAQALYLNIGVPGLITADSSVLVNGTVDIYYIDLGKKV